ADSVGGPSRKIEAKDLQRCLSRVRAAFTIDGMRFGLILALRKIRQHLRRAKTRSTGMRGPALLGQRC
ncbi:hypothetical protein, partial [Streptomyces sp. NPDC056663]|uniref:hypothetical protein n=1 Tax=Streptomyces sp. NPDC056663 TaxID=3345899 RepID=UPI003694989D